MKNLFKTLGLLILVMQFTVAFAQVTTVGGGTGSTSPSGILNGVVGNLHLQTLKVGTGLTFDGTTLAATSGSGASTTLLGDSNTFSGTANKFTNQLTATGGLTSNNQFNLSYSGPAMVYTNTGATTDNKNWVFGAGPTTFQEYVLNDTGSVSTQWLNVNRSGTTVSNIIFETGASPGTAALTIGSNQSLTVATTTAGCVNSTTGGLLYVGTCISSTFGFPFTPTSYGNATGTLIGFTGGILSVGSSTFVGNGTTTGNHAFGSIRIPTLGVSAGTFIAVDPNGLIIATTTPQGSSGAFSPSANYGTVAGLPSYTATGGVITEVGTGALSVDGNNPTVGQIVLVKNESGACTSSAGTCQNGLYNVTAAGSGIAAFVLTRNANYNSSSNVIPGIVTYIISGATLADDFWALTTPAPITVGTTGLTYVEVSGGGAAVTSVSNSDASLTISPTAGAVVASLNVSHFNAWNTQQTFTSLFATLASTTNATTTNLTVTASTTLGTILNGAGLTACTGGTNALTWSGGSFGCQSISASGSTYPFTPTTWGNIVVSATSTTILAAGGVFGTSTIGTLVASSSITNQGVKSALVLDSATGLEGAYGGAAGCTNQFVTALSALGASTCTSLTLAAFPTIAANTVLANSTSATAVPTAIATSSLFTFSTAFAVSPSVIQSVDYKTFTVYATTTSGFTGTSTTPLGFTDGSTWSTIKCIPYGTNAAANALGFIGVDFFWNTSHLNFIYASSTVGTTTFSTNNILPLNQPLFVSMGSTTANTVQAVSCTVKRTL